MRGFKTLAGARLIRRAHAFLQNLRGHFFEFGEAVGPATMLAAPSLWHIWDRLTGDLLVR